ncbi:MAG: hypothetical protein GY870_19140 [archaeon]|nr:hypothetical protein [archaeon]
MKEQLKTELITEFISVSYKCKNCKKMHKVKVKKSLIDNSKSFPVHYIYIHGEPPIITTLYIDSQYNIRGVEFADAIGMNQNQLSEILFKSKSFTLNSIPKDQIYGILLTEKGKIIKFFQKPGYEQKINLIKILKFLKKSKEIVTNEEFWDEIFIRYSDFWIVGLEMLDRLLIMVIDSDINIDRLKTQVMAVFETLE